MWELCPQYPVHRTRNKTQPEIVGSKPVNEHIENQRIKWFGHLTRRKNDQPALRAYYTRTSGFRAKGRPKRKMARQYRRENLILI
jgi:hypothetical protein